MNPTLLFLFAGLPIAIGIVGIIAGETFRARNMSPRGAVPEGSGAKDDVELEQILTKIRLAITENRIQEAQVDIKKAQSDPNLGLSGEFTEIAAYRLNVGDDFYKKSGDVYVGTLRKTYGEGFASGLGAHERLMDVLSRLDKKSLSKLIHDYEAGVLRNVLMFVKRISGQGM
jgi:hypothetical protein